MAERALSRRLRRLLLQFKAEFDPVSATYETPACALDGLDAALDVDFPYSKRKRKYAGKRTVAAVSAGGVRKLGWTWLGCCMTFARSTTAAVADPPRQHDVDAEYDSSGGGDPRQPLRGPLPDV